MVSGRRHVGVGGGGFYVIDKRIYLTIDFFITYCIMFLLMRFFPN